MSKQHQTRRIAVVSLVVALGLVVGGVILWMVRAPGAGSGSAAGEAARERERLAAFDPTFDPAKPSGSIAGLVRDGDGKPVITHRLVWSSHSPEVWQPGSE